MKFVRTLGRFLFDFFVGDTPEIFVAVVIVLSLAALVQSAAPWIILAGAVVTLLVTLARAKSHS